MEYQQNPLLSYSPKDQARKHDLNNANIIRQIIIPKKNFALSENVIPNKIGLYLLKETIGHGAFSIVKIAVHVETNEQYGCKIISKKRLLGNDMENRFEKEVRILQKLRHSKIATLYDLLKDSINYYLILELCPNGTLFDYIVSKNKIPENEAKYIFKQIVVALKYIHSQNVIHRDIKPENILIDEQNNIKFIDFGFSAYYDPDNLSKTNCHTPNYASPQCLSGLPYDGQKSDIWSLGVLLFTMLNGKIPWTSKNQKQLIEEIINSNIFLPLSMSEEVRDLLSHIIVKDPEGRYSLDQILDHPWLANVPDTKESQFTNLQLRNNSVLLSDVDLFFKNSSFKSCTVLRASNSNHILSEGKIALARANRRPKKEYYKQSKKPVTMFKVKSFD